MLKDVITDEVIQRFVANSTPGKLYLFPQDRNKAAGEFLGVDLINITRSFPDEDRVRMWWMVVEKKLIGNILYQLPGGHSLQWSWTQAGLGAPKLTFEASKGVRIESETDLMELSFDPESLLDMLVPDDADRIRQDLAGCKLTVAPDIRNPGYFSFQTLTVSEKLAA